MCFNVVRVNLSRFWLLVTYIRPVIKQTRLDKINKIPTSFVVKSFQLLKNSWELFPQLYECYTELGIITLRQSLRIAFKDSFLCLRLPFIHYFCIQIKRLIFTIEFSALIKKEIMFKIWYLLCEINTVYILRLHIDSIKDP